jgi:hypothetical protein
LIYYFEGIAHADSFRMYPNNRLKWIRNMVQSKTSLKYSPKRRRNLQRQNNILIDIVSGYMA